MNTIREALAIAFAHHSRGELAQAENIYRQILEQQPLHADVLHRLGVLVLQTGHAADAVTLLERSVAENPYNAPALTNLGLAYSVTRRYDEARVILEEAVRLDPANAGAYGNLGMVLHNLGRPNDAVSSYRKSLQLEPDSVVTNSNLGVALQDLSRLDESQQCYERARELAPNQAVSHFNMATVLKDQGHLAAAIDCFEQALRLKPDDAQALCGLGTVWLSMGDFAAGWAAYEHRVGCPQFNTFQFPQPLWDGSPLADRTLLIHCEQGLGDTLQFIRYVKLAEERGNKIIVAAQPALIPLLAQSGFTGLVPRNGPLPAFDVHAPLMSLPNIFRTTEQTVPRDVPYLAADEERTARWREKLSQFHGLKVGIAWQGRMPFTSDRMRSIALEQFAPLARIPNVRLLSLQKGPGSEQIAALAGSFEVIDLAEDLDPAGGAFLDTAAVMKSLDLVVMSDTGPAHLAGALGVPIWMALGRTSEWRWMLNRADSPWYPTMRLFRQPESGGWQPVFEAMARKLKQGPEGAA